METCRGTFKSFGRNTKLTNAIKIVPNSLNDSRPVSKTERAIGVVVVVYAVAVAVFAVSAIFVLICL
jgi:hypothetical protein